MISLGRLFIFVLILALPVSIACSNGEASTDTSGEPAPKPAQVVSVQNNATNQMATEQVSRSAASQSTNQPITMGSASVVAAPKSPLTDSGLQVAANSNAGIWVTGKGSIDVQPDLVLLNVGVETNGETVAEAMGQAGKSMDSIVKFIKSKGLEDKDMQTKSFNIYPRYEYPEITGPSSRVRKQVLVGYIVNNSVIIKVRNIDNLGVLIDGVTEVGENSIRVNGIEFTRDDIEPFMDDLRKGAVENAIDKANQFAKFSGVSLGGLIHLSEMPVSSYPRGDMFETRAFASPALISTPIQEGTLKYTLDVQAGFSIE